jgi:hypothetical protein
MLGQRGIGVGGDLRPHGVLRLGGDRARTTGGRAGDHVATGALLATPAEQAWLTDVKDTGDLNRRHAGRQGTQRSLTEVDGVRAGHAASPSHPCQHVNDSAIRSR